MPSICVYNTLSPVLVKTGKVRHSSLCHFAHCAVGFFFLLFCLTISGIYYLGYFQVKYNNNNIAEAFFMIEVLTYIFHVWNFL